MCTPLLNIQTLYMYCYIVLQIYFEEADYYVTEGDLRPPTIRLQFRKTQNPFTMTLFSVTIANLSGFSESAATPGRAVEATLGIILKSGLLKI